MTRCSRCDTLFECGMDNGSDSPCWCTQLPSLPVETYRPDNGDGGASRCFCPDCLRALTGAAEAAPQKNP